MNLTTGNVVATHGIMNPQIRFGEDLMSRVSYVMMHSEGAGELTRAVRQGVNDLIGGVCSLGGIGPADVVELTVVGNPIMHHLFLGLDPRELGGAPFALAVDTALDLKARDIGIGVNSGANVYMLPCIAGHVGADAAGMVLAEEPHLLDEISLVVDVGTNAEIVLGNRDRLLACSSPTGPAFEGAQISGGQRATNGAVERVRIDPKNLEPRYSVIGSELWSDDPEFDAATRAFGVTGICGSGIIEVIAEMYLAGIIKRGWGRRRFAGEPGANVSSPTAALSRISCTTARSESSSRRTTCARCNSPRRRCTRASGCCRTGAASTGSIAFGLPARSVPTSIRNTRWSWG